MLILRICIVLWLSSLSAAIAQNAVSLLDELGTHHSRATQFVQNMLNGDTTSVSRLQQQLKQAQVALQSAQTAANSLASSNATVAKLTKGLQAALAAHQGQAANLLAKAQTELTRAKPNLPKVQQYARQAQALLAKAQSVTCTDKGQSNQYVVPRCRSCGMELITILLVLCR